MNSLIEKLINNKRLSTDEYEELIINQNNLLSEAIFYSNKVRNEIYSNKVFIRGLIEVGNYCRNDCYYCGIRKSNINCERYLLTKSQIMKCCEKGYELGFRTFVLQGGENCFKVEKICEIVEKIKRNFNDCAVTLSFGEYKKEDYKKMFDSGADRYLLRHETADKNHYNKLHPNNMSFENRMQCLYNLKEIGFQVGCGFMVGSPFQTTKSLAKDLKFIEEFSPDMCGIGPFVPHKDTIFAKYSSGALNQTIYLLSLIRLIKPNILLPATTALGTINENGRILGIKAGANVIMPNLSPISQRKKYMLYDNKKISDDESANEIELIKKEMEKYGYEVTISRGDIKK